MVKSFELPFTKPFSGLTPQCLPNVRQPQALDAKDEEMLKRLTFVDFADQLTRAYVLASRWQKSNLGRSAGFDRDLGSESKHRPWHVSLFFWCDPSPKANMHCDNRLRGSSSFNFGHVPPSTPTRDRTHRHPANQSHLESGHGIAKACGCFPGSSGPPQMMVVFFPD